MNAHQITTLIIRLTALAWFLYLFDHIGNLLIYFNQGSLEHPTSLAWNLAFTLFQFGCAIALWFYPATTAAKSCRRSLQTRRAPRLRRSNGRPSA